MITKEQEKAALNKIRQIFAALGADSYVVVAFEGCVEIAEENIRNDSACSMKQRAESAEKELEVANARVNQLHQRIADEQTQNERFKEMLEDAINERNELKKRSFSPDDKAFFKSLLNEKYKEVEKRVDEASVRILDYADTPDCTEFKDAVRERKAAIAAKEYYQGIYDRLVYKEVCDES